MEAGAEAEEVVPNMVATRVSGAGPEVADRGVECGLRIDASDGSSMRVYTARNWYRVNQVVP